MADQIGEFFVRVTSDTSDVVQGIPKAVGQAADAVEDRFDKMSGKMKAALGAAGAAGVALLVKKFSSGADDIEERSLSMTDRLKENWVTIGGGLVGGFAFERAVAQFDALETKATEVLTLLPNQSRLAFDVLSADILKFQEDIRVSTEEAVPALYQAISAGQGDDPFGFLAVAREAALGGVSELETSVAALSSAVNAYGDETVTATRVSDVYFTAVKLGVTTFGELADAMPNVTANAAALGVQVEETAAAVAVLTQKGFDTTRSTTFLRAALVELSKSGTEASEVFQELSGGLNFQDFIAEGNTFIDVVDLIADAAEAGQVSVIDMFGSVEAGQAILTLTADGGNALNETFAQMQGSFGATAQAAETMSRTAESVRGRIGALVQTAQQAFGARVQPAIVEMLLAFEELLPAVIDLADTLGGSFSVIVAASVPLVQAFAEVVEQTARVLSLLPEELIAGAIAFKILYQALSVLPLGLTWFATSTKVGIAAMGGLSAAFNGFAKIAPRSAAALSAVGTGISTASAAVVPLAAALAIGAVGFRKYHEQQREAAQRAEDYALAVKAAVDPSTSLDAVIQRLRESYAGLNSELGGEASHIDDRTAELQGMAAVVGLLSDGTQEVVDEFIAFGGSLDDISGALTTGTEVFGEFQTRLLKLGEGKAIEFLQGIAESAADPRVRAAAAEFLRFADAADLNAGELFRLADAFDETADAADELRSSEESRIAEMIRGDAFTQEYAAQTLALADHLRATTDTATPFIDAVEHMASALGAAEQFARPAAAGIADVEEAQRDALAVFLEAGGTLEDLADDYAGLVGPLSEVDNLMRSILDTFNEQFDAAASVAEATGNLHAAYEDLGETFVELTSANNESNLAELARLRAVEDASDADRARAVELVELILAEEDAAEARRESVRSLDLTTDAGRAAVDQIIETQRATQDMAESMLASGDSIGAVNQFLTEQEEKLFLQITAMGVAETTAMEYISTLDTTPEAVDTLIELVGADATVEKLSEIIGGMEDVPDTVKAELVALGADATLEQVLGLLEPLGLFDEFKAEAEVSLDDSALKDTLDGMLADDVAAAYAEFGIVAAEQFLAGLAETTGSEEALGARTAEGEAIGGAYVSGVAAGIRANRAEVEGAAAELSAAMTAQMTSDLEIESPSRVGAGIGEDFDAGIAQGLLAGKTPEAIEDLVSQLSSLGSSINLGGVFTDADPEVDNYLEAIQNIRAEVAKAADGLKLIEDRSKAVDRLGRFGDFENLSKAVSSGQADALLRDIINRPSAAIFQTLENELTAATDTQQALQNLTAVETKAIEVGSINPTVEVDALADVALEDLATVLSLMDQADGRVSRSTVIIDTVNTGGDVPGAEAGGVFDAPGAGVVRAIGEAGREYLINTGNAKYRGRSEALIAAAARELGMAVTRYGSTAGPPTPQGAAAAAPKTGAAAATERIAEIVFRGDTFDQASAARLVALDLEELLFST